jgi:D-threo-aldose 1-dehydrogenase
LHLNRLGKTDLNVTPLCVGPSPLGNFPAQYGYGVGADQAVAIITHVLDGAITFIDTSNNYGDGESERRIGKATAQAGGLPDHFVLATKVDSLPDSDFSGRQVRESVRESRQRLGLQQLQLVYLHDPERITFEEATAPEGAVEALIALRDDGVIEYIGVADGPIDLERRYVGLGVFDAVISHNRYALVDQTAEPLIQDAADHGIAFVNVAPYGGGMLVRGPDVVPNYCYRPASEATLDRVRNMRWACEAREVPLVAAALQFSLRDSRVASTIVGMSSPERVDQTVRLAEWPIDDDLWAELMELAAPGREGVGL